VEAVPAFCAAGNEGLFMRIIFMGTPDFAVPTLDALAAAGHDIAAVYSQPPRKAGRGKQLRPSAVHARAEQLGLEVRHPVTLKDAATQAQFAALHADIAVVAAYGLILPRAILDAPLNGCLNVHGSLLPRWRGAAPVQRAILAGDEETGVMIMQMEAGLDTGPVRATSRTPIAAKTAGDLTEELARMGAQLLVEVLRDLPAYAPIAQSEDGVTYASKIDKAESRLDFSQSAAQVERQIRAFNPVPGAWFTHDGVRHKVLSAQIAAAHGEPGEVLDDRLTIACGTGAVRPTIIQRAGKPAMAADDLLRGKPIAAGTQL